MTTHPISLRARRLDVANYVLGLRQETALCDEIRARFTGARVVLDRENSTRDEDVYDVVCCDDATDAQLLDILDAGRDAVSRAYNRHAGIKPIGQEELDALIRGAEWPPKGAH